MLTDIGAQASAVSGKRLHSLNMGKPRASAVVDVDGRIVKLNGDEIGSNRVISNARITVEIPIPFGLHRWASARMRGLSCRRRRWTRSQFSIALLSLSANEHYHAPQDLRQGPRASSNFPLFLNQELR